jgi:hypothetical protein
MAHMSMKDAAGSGTILILIALEIILLSLAGYIVNTAPGVQSSVLEHLSLFIVSAVSLAGLVLSGLRTLYDDRDRREVSIQLGRISRESYLLGRWSGIIGTIAFLAASGMFCAFMFILIAEGRVAWTCAWSAYAVVLRLSVIAGLGLLFFSLGVGYPVNIILLLSIYIMGVSMNDALSSLMVLGKNFDASYQAFMAHMSLVLPNLGVFNSGLNDPLQRESMLLSTLSDMAYCLFYTAAALFMSLAAWKKSDL